MPAKSKLEQRIGRHRRSSNANYNPKMHTGKGESTSAKDIVKLQAQRKRLEARKKREAAAIAASKTVNKPGHTSRTKVLKPVYKNGKWTTSKTVTGSKKKK